MGATRKKIRHTTHFEDHQDTRIVAADVDVAVDSKVVDLLTEDEWEYFGQLIRFTANRLHIEVIQELRRIGKYPDTGGSA